MTKRTLRLLPAPLFLLPAAFLFLAAGSFSNFAIAQSKYSLEPHDGGVRVLLDGELSADYLVKSKSKPIIWPLVGPSGKKMTRDYPMIGDSKNEAHDHPHHRSMWFTHGDVNGVDFWLEGGQGGLIEHQEFKSLSAGNEAVICTSNLWKTADGEPVLSDVRRFTFGTDSTHPDSEQAGSVGSERSYRWVDCEIELIASHGDVNFGDTKEGSFGLRIAESMKVDAKGEQAGGKIVNSKGDEDKSAWGVPAEWVDYCGPIGDETYGIAILCHPSTFNFPNRWHVRTYGLFAANPFGIHHFTGQKEPTAGMVLPSGDSWLLRYRVVLHSGSTDEAKIGDQFEKFAKREFKPLR